AWITSQLRLVRPFGRETLVSPLKPRLRNVRRVSVEGRVKTPKRFWDRSRLVNRVRLVGKDGLLSRLFWRLSESKFVANSNPARLVMLRLLASRFVRLSRACWVNGADGICNALRTAAFNPGSGMEICCARAENKKPRPISDAMR